jgi:(p)ppGpp synthase/HD superfamily hydrolase
MSASSLVTAGAARPPLLKLAFDWAAVWHKDQHRKYPNTLVPYMSHVAGVAAVLSRHGFSEEVVAAGALHDVMEDCGIAHDDLCAKFGVVVADLVRHVSEQDKSLSWEDRKRLYLEHFSEKPWEAQAITLADKIDNFQSILVCAMVHGNPWAMFKRGRGSQISRFYDLQQRALKLVAAHPLVDEYVRTLAEVEALPDT